MWVEYKEQAAGMGCSRLEWCKGLPGTAWITGTASIRAASAGGGCKLLLRALWASPEPAQLVLPWGMKPKDRQIYGHCASLTEQQWFYIMLPSYQRRRESSPGSEWLQHHSSVNTRWQKPTSLQWFLAREKLQMQVNYWFFIQVHLSSNENCKCQWVAEIECSISTWGFSAFFDIYSKKAHELTAAFYIITLDWLENICYAENNKKNNQTEQQQQQCCRNL